MSDKDSQIKKRDWVRRTVEAPADALEVTIEITEKITVESSPAKAIRKGHKLWRSLGPGVITGAADDDPSGIATYSQTGAQFGYGLLWTALYQIPLLMAIQEAVARIGATTGKGLASVMKDHYGKKIMSVSVLMLVIANTINAGADIGAVAASVRLIWDVSFNFLVVVTAVGVLLLEVLVGYKKYASVLKWLGLALLAYVFSGIIVKEPWGTIAKATLIPHINLSVAFLFLAVGVFGTTISPYMFFWQASEEVEEEIAENIIVADKVVSRKLTRFIRHVRLDTFIGMIFAEVIQWFIIIVCASVLFSHGVTNISTAAQAAQALQPFAGSYAKDLFAFGIVGVGLMAIPVFAGSSSYAISEVFGWDEGLSKKLKDAKAFYGVIIISTLIGLGMNFLGINPIHALVWTAVLNGLVAVPLIYFVARINSDKKILGSHVGGRLSRSLVWITFSVMGLAALALIGTTIHF